MEESRCAEPRSCQSYLPKCFQKSRTARPPLRRGFSIAISSCKDSSLSNLTAPLNDASPGSLSIPKKEIEFFMARCNMSSAEPSTSSSREVQPASVELLRRDASADPTNNRIDVEHSCDLESPSLTPEESEPSSLEFTSSRDAWLAPESLVWVRLNSLQWWPAEIVGGEGALQFANDESNKGFALVKIYGSDQHAWVDPSRRLSPFNHFFKERSNNPLKEFQKALKQALHGEGLSLSEHSADRCDISSSNRISADSASEGRGKRKLKPKVHFDDITIPETPVRKVRRMKIMRYLGLTAPVGSPFSQSRTGST